MNRILCPDTRHDASQATFLTGIDNPCKDQILASLEMDFDAVYQLSDIKVALPEVCRKVGLPTVPVQRLNADSPEDEQSLSSHMTESDREFIREHCSADYFLCDAIPSIAEKVNA